MNTLILINKNAGSYNPEIIPKIESIIKKSEHNQQFFLEVVSADQIVDTLDRFTHKIDTLIIGGGDGTINTALNHIYGKNVTIGIIPLGTFNHLSKDLNFLKTTKPSLDIILSKKTKSIDLAKVNGKIFATHFGIGFYTKFIKTRVYYQKKGFTKLIAAFPAFMLTLLHFHIYKIAFKTKTKSKRIITPVIFIGNSEFHLKVTKNNIRENLKDGVLSFYYLDCKNRLCLFKSMLLYFLNLIRDKKFLKKEIIKDIIILPKNKSHQVTIDGELINLKPPYHLTVIPKAIKIKIL